MIARRIAEHVKAHNWFAVAIDFVIVVLGVFVGIQVSNWNAARIERATEQRYLQRLLADVEANILELERTISLHVRREEVLAGLELALRKGGDAPPSTALDDALCRWFVQPLPALQQATYDELVANGGLSVLRDEELRILLSRQQAAHTESARLDVLTPAIRQAAAPIDEHRTWIIERGGNTEGPSGDVTCQFDVDGMRNDARTANAVAQLFRNEKVYEEFRGAELEIARQIRGRLAVIMGGRNKNEASS